MSSTVALIAADIARLSRRNDFEGLAEATATLLDLVTSGEAMPDVTQARAILGDLRRKRQFEPSIGLAEALLAKGIGDVRVRRLYAQALIDTKQIDKALSVLEPLAAEASPDSAEWREAKGLLGRAWKQRHVEGDTTTSSRDGRTPLAEAVFHYAAVPTAATLVRDHWHVINFIALCARAERDHVDTGHDTSPRAMAKGLIDALEPEAAKADADTWLLASLGEAYLARGEFEKAKSTYARYAATPDADAFELFSSLRQIVEVWQLKRGQPGGEIIDVLEQALSAKSDKQISFSIKDREFLQRLERASVPGPAAVGVNGMLTKSWSDKANDQIAAIARIEQATDGLPLGTGFLVRGARLSPSLPDELLLLTNSHVVGRRSSQGTPPELAVARFTETAHSGQPFEFVDIVWESSLGNLDATLLRLHPSPEEFDLRACALTDLSTFPTDIAGLAEARQRCLVSGHAHGWQITWTPYPHPIIDVGYRNAARPDHVFIYHLAPTEPGNSGSPLFNDRWEAIGLHRARQNDGGLRPLGGRTGYTEQNAREAVSLRSIGEQITRDLLARAASASAGQAPAAASVEYDEQAVTQDEAETGDLLAGYEIDPVASRPFAPALRAASAGRAGTPQGPIANAGLTFAASAASVALNKVQNRAFTKAKLARPPRGLTLVAEGDSWFQFPFPHIVDTIGHLRRTHNIFSIARAGQELKEMTANAVTNLGKELAWIRPDGVLLSGGGNDLLGYNGLALHLRKHQPGQPAENYIRDNLATTLLTIEDYYVQIIEVIADFRSETDQPIKVFGHGYENAIPRADGSVSWLNKPMKDLLGVEDLALQRHLVRLLIGHFNEMMMGLETKFPGTFHYVDCRGAVGPRQESWFDELHPRTAGFARVAGRFNRRIADAFQGDPRVDGIA